MASTTTAAELRTLDADDLADKLREAKEELFNLRFQAATGQLESNVPTAASQFGVRRHRNLAAPLEPPQEGSLGGNGERGRRMV